MIVDHSLYARLVLRDMLVSHGYSVAAEVNSGREAVAAFAKARPDLVIVDAVMPDMDGVATTRELKREYPDAVVIITASRGQRSAVTEGISAGAADFIVKPYAHKRVIQIIRKTIG